MYKFRSTDNLVISAFISTVTVSYFVNYTTVVFSLKALTSGALSPIGPTLGNYLLDEEDGSKREKVFLLNTFVCYVLALIIVIPMVVLVWDFIIWRFGENMVLETVCNIVLSLVLVRYLGIADVLIGTVVSQIIFWIGRSGVVYKECLKVGWGRYAGYLVRNIYFIIAAVAMDFVVQYAYGQMRIRNVLIKFIVGGVAFRTFDCCDDSFNLWTA